MSGQEFMILQKSSNVVWMPTPITEEHKKLPTVQNSQTYYRSQAFTAHISINPLIACAYPLLTLATRLSETNAYHDLTHLYQMLLHEIRVFENQAETMEYRQSSITIACYLLCVLLDEIIIQSHWGKAWEHYSLLASLHHEEPSKERVFHIIDRLLQHPSQHLDVLELAYLCLSFGLKDPYQKNPSQELLEKLDETYFCIREERREISQGFLVKAQLSPHTELTKRKSHLSLSFAMLLSTSVVAAAYYIFCYGLKLVSTPLAHQLAISAGN